MSTTTDIPLLRETLLGVAEATRDELRASAAEPGSRFVLRDGRQTARSGPNHLWSFEFDGELPLGPEASAQLIVEGRDPLTATVLAVGDLNLLLSVRDELGESLASAVLVTQPLFILEALHRRLTDASEQLLDTTMLEQLLDLSELDESDNDDDEPMPPHVPSDEPPELSAEATSTDGGLSYEQLAAAQHATRDGLRFVWGPPGTGKTSTLAAAVTALAEAGRRVMVVAHSNAAVDVAMARVAQYMAGSALLESDKVLRVGTPQLVEARDCYSILPDEIIARRFPDLGEQRRRLQRRREALSSEIRAGDRWSDAMVAELDNVRTALTEIDRKLEEGQALLISEAQVVGCTLAKLVIDPQLWAWERDAVILDEASMAGLPYVIALAAGAPRTLACFGDFRQLPPIAVSERAAAQAWFGRDVFELAGVVSRVEDDVPDPRLAILRTQYRMGETIATAVSDVAYFSLLFSDVSAIERAHGLAALKPMAGSEVTIVDTSCLNPLCLQDSAPRSFSRYSLHSAAVTAALAQQANAAGLEVGVISPYRAQVAVLAALLRSTTDITVATMHRFQGSERDAIIIDLVDSQPEKGPSRLTGKDEDLALRLLNVGISRAKGKLLIVANLPFLRERSGRGSPALQFIDAFIELGAPVVSAEWLTREPSTASIGWMPNWWAAVQSVVSTGQRAPLQLALNSADFAGDDLADRLQELASTTGHMTVHAPIEVASRIDRLGLDLRLLPLGAGQLAVCKGNAVVVGGSHYSDPVAVLRGAAITGAVQRLLQREA